MKKISKTYNLSLTSTILSYVIILFITLVFVFYLAMIFGGFPYVYIVFLAFVILSILTYIPVLVLNTIIFGYQINNKEKQDITYYSISIFVLTLLVPVLFDLFIIPVAILNTMLSTKINETNNLSEKSKPFEQKAI
ncbi:hypothetical protein ACR82Z_04740 [Mycoplasma sp. 6243]|uniref:hypothetical protein n=1 Tax=Mycoplasma sp. 6243 TaxID=3440865 RepID=UPI003EBF6268